MKISQNLAKKIYWLFLLFLGFSLLLPIGVAAEKMVQKDVFISDEVFDNVYFAAGENVNINAQFNDDVYVAGSNVVISGVIEGDLLVAGANLVINAEIKGDLRALGATVRLNNKISKNATIGAADLTLTEEAEIGKNLIFGAGNVNLESKINKNLYGGGGNILLNNQVGGNVYLGVDPEGSLVLYPQTDIAGNLEYTATNKADLKPGAQIGQEERFSQMDRKTAQDFKAMSFKGFGVAFWLISLLGALLVGFVLVYIFKDFINQTQKIFTEKIAWSMLIGFIYLIVTPIALIIIAVTMIGLPLALIAGALYVISLYLSKIFVGIYIGDKLIRSLFKKEKFNLVWAMVLGVIVVYLLLAIPILGLLIRLLVCVWGLGVLLIIIKGKLNFAD